jgi:hypothetical protein
MPAPTVVLELKSATVWYHADTKIIHHQIRSYTHGDDLRKLLNTGLDHMAKVGAKKWLSDDTGNGALKPEDGAWAQNDWAPRAMKAGWKFWAIVMPKSTAGKMNLNKFIEDNAKMGLTVQVFETAAEALKWLATK